MDADVAEDPERKEAALRAAGVHLAKDDDLVTIMTWAKTEEEGRERRNARACNRLK
jgi:hypothetical protein